MKKLKLVILPLLLATSSITMAFASCSSSGYGTTCTNADYNLTKTVVKNGFKKVEKRLLVLKKVKTLPINLR